MERYARAADAPTASCGLFLASTWQNAPSSRATLLVLVLRTVSRRGLVLGLSACAATLLVKEQARAGVARPIGLSELVRSSRHTLVGVPREAFSRWEMIGKGRRIVTHTRLGVDRLVAGAEASDGELWVRTLGGRV